MDAKTLLALIDLQCEYTRLQTRCGLIGVDLEYVHLSLSEFLDLWPGRDFKVVDRHSEIYPVKLVGGVFGIEFMAICNLEDLIQLNLSSFCPASLQGKLNILAAEMADAGLVSEQEPFK
jgi:hypothetical protein